jgi:hypothetical protein
MLTKHCYSKHVLDSRRPNSHHSIAYVALERKIGELVYHSLRNTRYVGKLVHRINPQNVKAVIRQLVEAARECQRARFSVGSNLACNAEVDPAEIEQFCRLEDTSRQLMRSAMSQLGIAARGFHRTRSMKLARTIADLAAADQIQPPTWPRRSSTGRGLDQGLLATVGREFERGRVCNEKRQAIAAQAWV